MAAALESYAAVKKNLLPNLRAASAAAKQLKEAAEIARTVRGWTPLDDPSRRVSEDFTAALARLRAQGITYSEITRVTGLTMIAIRMRLGRHGHKTHPPSQAPYQNKFIDHQARRRVLDAGDGGADR